MGISFESLISDIAGRSGRLVVGRKTVKTPALLPVINPHLQLITPKELRSMGVEALITNAYIFSQSRQFRDRALSEGLHRVLGESGRGKEEQGGCRDLEQMSCFHDKEL